MAASRSARRREAGGGIGVPPMLELAKQLKAEKLLVMGYRDKRFLEEELQQNKEAVRLMNEEFNQIYLLYLHSLKK